MKIPMTQPVTYFMKTRLNCTQKELKWIPEIKQTNKIIYHLIKIPYDSDGNLL